MKYNREEIVKALEICSDETKEFCTGCPFIGNGGCKQSSILKLALSVIKELTEENERLVKQCGELIIECDGRDAARLEQIAELIKENKELKADLAEAEAEYDRVYEQAEADIRGNMADGGTSCHWCIAGHRADAVKEMLNRVIDRAVLKVYDDDTERLSISTWELREIAQEILEENK